MRSPAAVPSRARLLTRKSIALGFDGQQLLTGHLGDRRVACWDPASATIEISLLMATATLMWLASRASPPERWPAVLALVISALALWGLWQVSAGMDQAATAIDAKQLALRTEPLTYTRIDIAEHVADYAGIFTPGLSLAC